MAHNSNNTVTKRFTYDWLIRFAELQPFQIFDFEDTKRVQTVRSKYAKISPIFTTIISKHTPYMCYSSYTNIKNGKFQNVSRPLQKNRCTVIGGPFCHLFNLTPGMVTKLEKNRVFFYAKSLNIQYNDIMRTESTMTFDDLQSLFKFCKYDKTITIHAIFTEPVVFSKIWPMVAHCEIVVLKIKNLIYGENMANVLRENRVIPKQCNLFCMDVSDKAVLEIFDFLLSLRVRPTFFKLRFLHSMPTTLIAAIFDKYKRAGLQAGGVYSPSDPFNSIQVSGHYGKADFYFSVEDDRS